MADLLYNIQWKDHNGISTALSWVRKGVTSGLSSYEFTAAGTPMVLKHNATDFRQLLRGSDISFNLLIKDSTDESHLLKLLEDTYYVFYTKNGTDRWYGQLFPRFFNTVYNTYPYEVQLTANDRLGLIKEETQYMIDFPEPTNYQAGFILGKILDSFRDGTTFYQHAPDTLRVCTPLYQTTQDRLLEEVYLDPRVFMDEDDQYLNKYEMLENLLKIWDMYLFQYKGTWYLVDLDAYLVDGLNLRYTEYTFSGGTLSYVGVSTESVYVDLFANKTDNKLINSTAFKSYSRPVSKLSINEKYVPRLNVFDVDANRSGNFYEGENGIELEFDSSGDLRNWTDEDTYALFSPPHTHILNDGWLKMPTVGGGLTPRPWKKKVKVLDLTTQKFQGLRISGSFYKTGTENLNFIFKLKLETSGPTTSSTYWLNSPTEDTYVWATTDSFFTHKGGLGHTSMLVDMALPQFTEIQTSVTLTLHLYPPIYTQPDVLYLLKNLQVQCINGAMDSINNTIVNEYTVASDVVRNEVSEDFIWGIGWNSFPGNGIDYGKDLNLSRILNSSGDSIIEFNSTLGYIKYNAIVLWKNKFIRYNSTPREILNGDVRSFDVVSPISIVEDYEGNKYVMINGSLDDKRGVWTGQWINVIEASGDYNEDYNDDYYK